jgi:hypothetical protein
MCNSHKVANRCGSDFQRPVPFLQELLALPGNPQLRMKKRPRNRKENNLSFLPENPRNEEEFLGLTFSKVKQTGQKSERLVFK